MQTSLYKKSLMKFALIIQLIVFCALSGNTAAEIIDDIYLKTDANGEVDAYIKFTVPIQYLRHFPQRKTKDSVIYFNILGSVPRDEWQNYESHRSPPSDVVKGFTVTTRDLTTGPKIEVQFFQPFEFSILPGKNNQVLQIHIRPDVAQQNKEVKAAPSSGGADASPSALPAAGIAPLIAVAPSLPVAVPKESKPAVSDVSPEKNAADTVSSKTIPVAAASAAKPVVPSAATVAAPAAQITPPVAPAPVAPAPVAPSGDVTAPKVVLTQQQLKTIRIPLGGKEGLPAFPEVDQVPAQKNAPSSEKLSLADQIVKTNNQAAALMEKGGRAILAGQLFAAIEAFNKVLNLPPNKYSPYAQVWIGITREKVGQMAQAKSEFETYIKLYPTGTDAAWVNARISMLTKLLPPPEPVLAKPLIVPAPAKVKATEFQTAQYGSLSMYYYLGNSQTDTVANIAGVQTPTRLSAADQSALITNVNLTARAYNNEYDNRLVFQAFDSKSFLKGQGNINRLNAAYYDVKSRVDNYSARIGRQSALGGGVMGRFDGISAGYGFMNDYRANISVGRLSDKTLDSQPKFISLGFDFGVNSPLGGSAYFINQNADGLTDRRAVGGNMRYFEQGKTAMAMLDYDLQFKALNIVTLQGTLNYESGTDLNFLLDRRRSPILDIRNAISGTTATISTLRSPTYGFSTDQLLDLAKARTAVSNVALVGVTQRIQEKWQAGTDLIVSNTSGLPQSGTCNADGTTGVEGCVNATPTTGNAWTINGRVNGSDIFSRRDISMVNISYSKSQLSKGEAIVFFNHAYPRELWTFDTTLRLFKQTTSTGGKSTTVSPVFKTGYQMRSSLVLEGEVGTDVTNSSTTGYTPSRIIRKYCSFGFRWDI